jgi:chromosome segregation ATPase
MTDCVERRLLVSMNNLEPLFTEIATLLDQEEGDDDAEQLERTLTDGYAQALTLEAERTSLERQVLRLSLDLDEHGEAMLSEVKELARQLHACDDSCERLRGELVRLKRRHSRAVHATPGWACQTSPDRTA